MRILNVDGVDCFVFLEAMKLDKGMVINVFKSVGDTAPLEQREYVLYRNGILPDPAGTDRDKQAARDQARSMYENLTADDVREHLEAAKKLVP